MRLRKRHVTGPPLPCRRAPTSLSMSSPGLCSFSLTRLQGWQRAGVEALRTGASGSSRDLQARGGAQLAIKRAAKAFPAGQPLHGSLSLVHVVHKLLLRSGSVARG